MQQRFPPARHITWEDYPALAKEWRYEQLQRDLFRYHNLDATEVDESSIRGFTNMTQSFRFHCVTCLEARAESHSELDFLPVKHYAPQLFAFGEKECCECGLQVKIAY